MTMYPILVNGFVTKVYVNANRSWAVLFPPFGRYFQLNSDTDVLDFATNFLLAKHVNNVVSFASYQARDEDTAVIQIENIAA